jgi:hypothetical protein
MSRVFRLNRAVWSGTAPVEPADPAATLEAGDVLFLPNLQFHIEPVESVLFTPAILGSSKNASFDPSTGGLGGTTATGAEGDALRGLLQRFSDAAMTLVHELFPRSHSEIERRRASFRPAEIAGRATSWRKDDTRLHVDSFPATPSGGKRILRVFSNVNPEGRARSWRVGDDFEAVALRFAPQLRVPFPGSGQLLRLLRVTKTPRSPYDALMLQLHDRMKGDAEFQTRSPQSAFDFPAGSTWIAFTDQVSHAAMAGQYQLEQTFLMPVDAMNAPETSPLRILERLKRRRLA